MLMASTEPRLGSVLAVTIAISACLLCASVVSNVAVNLEEEDGRTPVSRR